MITPSFSFVAATKLLQRSDMCSKHRALQNDSWPEIVHSNQLKYNGKPLRKHQRFPSPTLKYLSQAVCLRERSELGQKLTYERSLLT